MSDGVIEVVPGTPALIEVVGVVATSVAADVVDPDAFLPAGPTGWTLIENALDYEVGDDVATARLIEIPLANDGGYVTILQGRFEGDAFPRFVLVSDGSLYIGDGTFNPLQNPNGFNGIIPSNAGVQVGGENARIELVGGVIGIGAAASTRVAIDAASGDATWLLPAAGPIISDRNDGHTYRIVSTDGVLSTELAT